MPTKSQGIYYKPVPLAQVAEMADAGQTHYDIANHFGIPADKAQRWVRRARYEGYRAARVPPPKSNIDYIDNARRRHGSAALGSMSALVSLLDRSVVKWLLAQTPQGADVTDTVRSIIVDAYEYENPGGKNDG